MADKTLIINERIDDELLSRIAQFYNDLGDDYAKIYLSSSGGYSATAEAIIDIINRNSFRTEVIGFSDLFSCGFEIFFSVKCQKRLLSSAIGMYHQSILTVEMNESWMPIESDRKKKEYITVYTAKKTAYFLENIGLSIEEKKAVKKGKDVYFMPDRMNELLEFSLENMK